MGCFRGSLLHQNMKYGIFTLYCHVWSPSVQNSYPFLHPLLRANIHPTRKYLAASDVAVTSWLRPCFAPFDLVTWGHDTVHDIAAPDSRSGVVMGVVRQKGVNSTLHPISTLNPSCRVDCSKCVTHTLNQSAT